MLPGPRSGNGVASGHQPVAGLPVTVGRHADHRRGVPRFDLGAEPRDDVQRDPVPGVVPIERLLPRRGLERGVLDRELPVELHEQHASLAIRVRPPLLRLTLHQGAREVARDEQLASASPCTSSGACCAAAHGRNQSWWALSSRTICTSRASPAFAMYRAPSCSTSSTVMPVSERHPNDDDSFGVVPVNTVDRDLALVSAVGGALIRGGPDFKCGSRRLCDQNGVHRRQQPAFAEGTHDATELTGRDELLGGVQNDQQTQRRGTETDQDPPTRREGCDPPCQRMLQMVRPAAPRLRCR